MKQENDEKDKQKSERDRDSELWMLTLVFMFVYILVARYLFGYVKKGSYIDYLVGAGMFLLSVITAYLVHGRITKNRK